MNGHSIIDQAIAIVANDAGFPDEASAADRTRAAATFLAGEFLSRLALIDPAAAGALSSATLDDVSVGTPGVAFDDAGLREQAEFWADTAHPREVEVYFAACLKRLQSQSIGLRGRKRLFAELWETFDPAERRAFVRRVDPQGKIRSAA